jgi:hypothetical protein
MATRVTKKDPKKPIVKTEAKKGLLRDYKYTQVGSDASHRYKETYTDKKGRVRRTNVGVYMEDPKTGDIIVDKTTGTRYNKAGQVVRRASGSSVGTEKNNVNSYSVERKGKPVRSRESVYQELPDKNINKGSRTNRKGKITVWDRSKGVNTGKMLFPNM